MGPYVWYGENLADFLPSVLPIEIDRFFTGIAPKPDSGIGGAPRVDCLEQGASHPGALDSVGDRHASQLVPNPRMRGEIGWY